MPAISHRNSSGCMCGTVTSGQTWLLTADRGPRRAGVRGAGTRRVRVRICAARNSARSAAGAAGKAAPVPRPHCHPEAAGTGGHRRPHETGVHVTSSFCVCAAESATGLSLAFPVDMAAHGPAVVTMLTAHCNAVTPPGFASQHPDWTPQATAPLSTSWTRVWA